MGSASSFLSYKRVKLKLRMFLAGHAVAMVTYCATKLTATCLPMTGQKSGYNDPSNSKSWKILETVFSHLNTADSIPLKAARSIWGLCDLNDSYSLMKKEIF